MTGSRSQAGMTLVEIMVVVSILSILAAVAIPTFRGQMPRIRLGTATESLSNEVAMLRMSAISRSSWYQATFNLGAESYSFVMPNPSPPPAEVTFSSKTIGAVDIESVKYLSDLSDVPTASVRFNSNGTTNVPLSRRAVLVTLSTPAGNTPVLKKRVVIETTGRIYAQKWNGGPVAAATSWIEE